MTFHIKFLSSVLLIGLYNSLHFLCYLHLFYRNSVNKIAKKKQKFLQYPFLFCILTLIVLIVAGVKETPTLPVDKCNIFIRVL